MGEETQRVLVRGKGGAPVSEEMEKLGLERPPLRSFCSAVVVVEWRRGWGTKKQVGGGRFC